MNELKIKGFLLLKNVIGKNDIYLARNSITKNSVNYVNIESYLDIIMKKIKYKTHLDLRISKYRVSNNNNSIDASNLHRDLHIHNNKTIPVYTCLSYLDNAIMELIPYSHKNFKDKIGLYNQKIELSIYPGDILIFNSSLVHTGIFYTNQSNRRLIQMFDCIEKNKFNTINSQILHIPCRNKCYSVARNISYIIGKFKCLNKLFSFLHYYICVSHNYGSRFNFLPKMNKYKNFKYISTESNNNRFIPKYNGFELQNVYIIKENIYDIEEVDVNNMRFYMHIIDYIYFFIILIIIIIIIVIFYKYSIS
jgi:hypothetical protein